MKHKPFATPRNDNRRIGGLSVLPVFLDLHGKMVCLVGNSEGAIWKAELLLSAGARLNIISETPSPGMLQFVSGVDDESICSYAVRRWSPDDFRDAFAVVADVEAHEARALCAAASDHTSLINIVDKPEFCAFQFGSIVNRSPLVIGISTSGAAPVLAQYVRSRIETILPAATQRLARKAERIRKRVNLRLGGAEARRAYWQAFFGRCFGSRKTARFRDPSRSAAHEIRVCSEDDLSVRDIRMLQTADRIEFQTGTDPRILEYGRREAQRFDLGSALMTSSPTDSGALTVRVLKAPGRQDQAKSFK